MAPSLIFNVKARHASRSLRPIGRSQPTWTEIVRLHGSMGTRRSRTNDSLPLASLGRIQGGDRVVESRDVADVRPQSSVPHPLDDLSQLGTIGLDDEIDREAVGGT